MRTVLQWWPGKQRRIFKYPDWSRQPERFSCHLCLRQICFSSLSESTFPETGPIFSTLPPAWTSVSLLVVNLSLLSLPHCSPGKSRLLLAADPGWGGEAVGGEKKGLHQLGLRLASRVSWLSQGQLST
jgi:hypothetical protein